MVRPGIDPIEQQRHAVAAQVTFRQAADHYLAAYEPSWRNPKHVQQWQNTLATACIRLGNLPVGEVDTQAVLSVLQPIWSRTPETASRLRGRIELVLDYAATQGWRQGDNPARWRGHLKNVLPPVTRVRPVEHHAALPWGEIGAFMVRLRAERAMAGRALEFVILTACRTNEALGAVWGEVNLVDRLWTVPAERTKPHRMHRVPLSDPAMALLRRVRPAEPEPDAPVFPSRHGQFLSDMAMLMLLRRIGYGKFTVHGFRSTFRDWAAETTDHAHHVAEAALAHQLGAVERAYQRADLLAKRRTLMTDWAQFLSAPTARTQRSDRLRLGPAEHG